MEIKIRKLQTGSLYIFERKSKVIGFTLSCNRNSCFMPTIHFQSSNHKRLERGMQVSHDFVPRFIQLEYSPNGALLTISILPTLSPKQAMLVNDNGSVLTYEGLDPDYRFEIETKVDNTIHRVSIELRYFE